MNKTRRTAIAVTIAAICLFIAFARSYVYNHSMVLELDHWQNPPLRVTETSRNGIPVVHISGGIIDSALAVTNVSTRKDGPSIVVLVHGFLAGAGFGRSGRLQYDVAVPQNVNDIRFGNKEAIIWRRDQKLN